jgi:hypothetical protein
MMDAKTKPAAAARPRSRRRGDPACGLSAGPGRTASLRHEVVALTSSGGSAGRLAMRWKEVPLSPSLRLHHREHIRARANCGLSDGTRTLARFFHTLAAGEGANAGLDAFEAQQGAARSRPRPVSPVDDKTRRAARERQVPACCGSCASRARILARCWSGFGAHLGEHGRGADSAVPHHAARRPGAGARPGRATEPGSRLAQGHSLPWAAWPRRGGGLASGLGARGAAGVRDREGRGRSAQPHLFALAAA